MRVAEFENIVRVLNAADVRYLVVGGIAVVAHGYGRVTFDLDVVLQLRPDNVIRAFGALNTLGYLPRVPVTAEQFAVEENRERWIREKGMTVLNLHSDRQRTTPVDVFVAEPFDFDATYARAIEQPCGGGVFRVVDLETLIRMKEAAGRPKDVDDVTHLRMAEDD
jgi:hypothetical protein